MKKFLRYFCTLLMIVVCAHVWADEVTFTPGTDTGETSVTKGGVTATMTTMNNASYYQIYANQSGTFSCSNGNITKIEFTCTANGTAKYGPGNASANVGSYSYSGNTGTWTGSAGSVTISTTAQIRMTSLTITYTTGSGSTAVATTTTIDATGITNTDVHTSTAAGSLSASVTETESGDAVSGATVTWSGNNDAVATIASDGTVTLVGAGSVTFTALYAGVTDQYQASSNNYELTVTDSTPFEGGDITFIAGTDVGSTTGNNSPDKVTKSCVTISSTDAAFAIAQYRFYKNSVTTFSTSQGVITKIEFTGVSSNPVSNFGETEGLTTSGNSGTWEGSAESVSFTASVGQVRATQIVVTVNTNGTAAPSITIADNNVIAYDGTSGSFSFAVANPADDGVVTASSNEEWISDVAVSGNTVTFTTTENETTTPREGVITLTYSYDNNSETVTKDVTVTQAAAPAPVVLYTTIPDLFDAATSTDTEVQVTFDGWVVSGVSTNGKNVFVTDNNGNGFVIFDNNGGLNNTYAVGNVLSGTAVSCTLKLYNGFAELINVNASDLTIGTGGTVNTSNIALADLAGVNTGALVHYDNLTCSVSSNKYYLSDGTTNLQVYNALFAFGTLENGKTYNITGIYQQYSNTKEILPRSADDIEEVVSTEPSVTLSTTTVSATAAETEGVITVTYNNIDNVAAEVRFFEADGTTSAIYSWVDAEIDADNNVYYVIEENTTDEARTAYLKVYANEVYSDLITITQAEPVVDYVTFENGTFAIGLVLDQPGITSAGLGWYSDDALKFDGTGDWLVVKTNEQIGTVFFDIKANTSSGTEWAGKFDVECSADGSNWTALRNYDSETSETVTTEYSKVVIKGGEIPAEARYIRWTYTEKTTGNVAVNHVRLYTPVKVTINPEIGLSTFSSNNRISFEDVEGLEAYIAYEENGSILLKRVYNIPAGPRSGVLLRATNEAKGGDFNVFVTGEDVENIDENCFFAGNNEAVLYEDPEGGYNYILTKVNEKFGFFKANGNVIPYDKAYLHTTAAASAGIFFDFDTTTGIKAFDNLTNDNSSIYDLQGRKVQNPTRGLYIVNGKKVVIK